ncbi:MAG: STAS domain-containing protein [Chloroflexi bacterium]|nr:STAS domain-containing protein [Chloroflexota bacterium]
MLNISQSQQGDKIVFQVDGRVDGDGATKMEDILRSVVNAGHHQLVLDLSQTNYLNSAGLRILADVLTQCRQSGGDVQLAAPNLKIMRVLEIIGFDKFFHVYPTLDAAIHS